MMKLLDAVTANANSDAIVWKGGTGLLVATGTWGSGTIAVQISPDGGTTWIGLTSITMTANGTKEFTAPAAKLRLALTGATNPSLTAWVAGTSLN